MVWLEYFGVITGLLYLFLEIKQHKAMWVVGFLTSLVYVFVFLSAKIYADMGLQTLLRRNQHIRFLSMDPEET